MISRISLPSLVLGLVLGFGIMAGPAAAIPAVTLDNTTGSELLNPPFTLGFSFSTSGAITVTALGLFDDSQNGLAGRHAVGIWDSGGSLLASTIVGAGTADPLTNQFRYASISPLNLLAGTYAVGALYSDSPTGDPATNDFLIFPGIAVNFATAGGITFLGSAYGSDPSLIFPGSTSGPVPAYFGANFLFTATNTSVPEPLTIALFSAGLAGLGAMRRRKKSV